MKKNKRTHRMFSRVLSRLAWAAFYHVNDENENAYKEVLAAKRCIEECGGYNVKVAFYDREYHITFEANHTGQDCNRYYTASASHGYTNDYHNTNKSDINHLIMCAEFSRDCTLRRDFHDYQMFNEIAESVLYAVLTPGEFSDYCRNGEVSDIPYDVAIQLWRDLGECLGRIVNEAVAYRKEVL